MDSKRQEFGSELAGRLGGDLPGILLGKESPTENLLAVLRWKIFLSYSLITAIINCFSIWGGKCNRSYNRTIIYDLERFDNHDLRSSQMEVLQRSERAFALPKTLAGVLRNFFQKNRGQNGATAVQSCSRRRGSPGARLPGHLHRTMSSAHITCPP